MEQSRRPARYLHMILKLKFKEVKEAGDTAVVICLSSLLSGTYQSAHIALDGYEDCITLVDSLNVCLGEQILVLYADKAAR